MLLLRKIDWENKMKHKNRYGLIAIIITSILLLPSAEISANENYYSNELGLKLSYENYAYLTQFVNSSDLDVFTQEEADYMIEHVENDGVETETKYIMTQISSKDGSVLTEEYLSEAEMKDTLNGRNIKVSSNDEGISLYGYDPSKRYATITTDMKKIELNMYSVSASVKKVMLKCTWLSIPKCKSYDLIGFRVPGYYSGLTIDINGTENVVGYQYYDGQKIKYDHTSDNIKKNGRGIGVSMNIVDSVSKSLSMSFSVNFGTSKDPFAVMGSYQHAVKNLSLSKSQRYDIQVLGMGDVFKFKSGVDSYYDNTPGLMVIGSLDV